MIDPSRYPKDPSYWLQKYKDVVLMNAFLKIPIYPFINTLVKSESKNSNTGMMLPIGIQIEHGNYADHIPEMLEDVKRDHPELEVLALFFCSTIKIVEKDLQYKVGVKETDAVYFLTETPHEVKRELIILEEIDEYKKIKTILDGDDISLFNDSLLKTTKFFEIS